MTGDGEWLAAGRRPHQVPGHGPQRVAGRGRLGRSSSGSPQRGRRPFAAILPRQTWFSRKAAGRGTEEQVIAANVDLVLIVFGLDTHRQARAIERYLTLARRSRVRPVVVLNKTDVAADVAGAVAEATTVAGDAPVLAVSAATGAGIEQVMRWLATGVTAAVLGPSGAGKSSLVNRLVGTEALATGEVREWDSARPAHQRASADARVRRPAASSSTRRACASCSCGTSTRAWTRRSRKSRIWLRACRFRDCQHDAEPGCAVKAAVEAGEIPQERYESYIKLSREQAATEKLRDERSLLDAKRQARIGSKAMKALQNKRGPRARTLFTGAEPQSADGVERRVPRSRLPSPWSLICRPQHRPAFPCKLSARARTFGTVEALAGATFDVQARRAARAARARMAPARRPRSRPSPGACNSMPGPIHVFGRALTPRDPRPDIGVVPQELAVYPLADRSREPRGIRVALRRLRRRP